MLFLVRSSPAGCGGTDSASVEVHSGGMPHTHTHTHARAHAHTDSTCSRIYVHTYVHTHTHMFMHSHTHICTCTQHTLHTAHTCTSKHVRTRTHTCTHVCTNTCTHTHINQHTLLSLTLSLSLSLSVSHPCHPQEGSSVMNRSQTDETKGWMQCVILIYHYTGTSKVSFHLPGSHILSLSLFPSPYTMCPPSSFSSSLSPPPPLQVVSVYLLVRVLVAAYLFLSGYGHFSFYWKTGNFKIMRFIQVILVLLTYKYVHIGLFVQSVACSVGDASVKLLHCAGCHGDGYFVRAILLCTLDLILVCYCLPLHRLLATSD